MKKPCFLVVALVTSFVMWIVDASSNGTLNMTPMQRVRHQQNALYVSFARFELELTKLLFFSASQILEREKLLSSSSVTPHDLLQPNSEFHIRNRYLSRIGAPVSHFHFYFIYLDISSILLSNISYWCQLVLLQLPSNYDVNMKGLAYRALR